MRLIKFINISSIYSERPLPLNPDTMELALKIKLKQLNIDALPPITVVHKLTGMYQLKDGRHRYVAFRLNGIEKIRARVSKEILVETFEKTDLY